MRHLSLGLAAAIGLLSAGCADFRHFAPRENENGFGPSGDPAAVYGFADAQAAGELRLWSRGSRSEADAATGDRVVQLHVGFELENTGTALLELAEVSCVELWVGETLRTKLQPIRVEGGLVAEPDSVARVHAWFRLDGLNSARELDAFTVRFAALADGVPVLIQQTPFSRYIRPNPRDHDPWFFSPYGYGFGHGYGSSYYGGFGFGGRCR